MKLVKIWESDLKKAYELQMSFPQEETRFWNSAYEYTFEQFVEYTKSCEKHSQGLELPEGFVPATVFVLVDDDENYVGIFNLRHHLNEFLAKGPGHIGYGISSKYRRMGYATKGLELMLPEAKKIGIEEAYLSCLKTNVGSIKAQLNNGAKVHREDDLRYYTRIRSYRYLIIKRFEPHGTKRMKSGIFLL